MPKTIAGLLVAALLLAAPPASAQRKSRITPPPDLPAVQETAETFTKEPACLVNGQPGPALAPYFTKDRNPFVLASPSTFHFHASVGSGVDGLQVDLFRLRRHEADTDPATLVPRWWVEHVTPDASGEYNDVTLKRDGGAYLVTLAVPGATWTTREVKARCRIGFSQLWTMAAATGGALDRTPVLTDTYDLTFTGLLVAPSRRDALLRLAGDNPLFVDGDDGRGDDSARVRWSDPRTPQPAWTDVQRPVPFRQDRLRYRLVTCSDEPLETSGTNAGQRACLTLARFTPDTSKACTLRIEGAQTVGSSRPIELLDLVGRSSLATHALVFAKAGAPLTRSAVRIACGSATFDGLPPGLQAILGNFTFAHTDVLVQAVSKLGAGRSADRCPATPAPGDETWSVFDQPPTDRRDVAVCAYRFAPWRGDSNYRSFESIGAEPEDAAFLKTFRFTLARTSPPENKAADLDGVGRYWIELPRPAQGPWNLVAVSNTGTHVVGTHGVATIPALQLASPPASLALPTLRPSELSTGLASLCVKVPAAIDLARFAADGGLTVVVRTGRDPLAADLRYAPTAADPRTLCPVADAAHTELVLDAVRRAMLDGRPVTLEVRQGERVVVPALPLQGPAGITVLGASLQLSSNEPVTRPVANDWPTVRVNALCVQTPLELGAQTELLSETRFDVTDDTGQPVGGFAAPPHSRTTYFRRTPAEAAEHLYCATPTKGGLDHRHLASPSGTARSLRVGVTGLACDDAAVDAGRCAVVRLSPFEVRLLEDALRDTHAGFAWGPVWFWGMTPPVPAEWRASLFFPVASVSMHPTSTVSLSLAAGAQGTLASGMHDSPVLRARFMGAAGGYGAACVAFDLPREAGALSPKLCAGLALDVLKLGAELTAAGIGPSLAGAEVVPYLGFELQRWR